MIDVKSIGSGTNGAFAALSRMQIFNVANGELAAVTSFFGAPCYAGRRSITRSSFWILQRPSLEHFSNLWSVVLPPFFGELFGLFRIVLSPLSIVVKGLIWIFLAPFARLNAFSIWIGLSPSFGIRSAFLGSIWIFGAMAHFRFARLVGICLSPLSHVGNHASHTGASVGITLRNVLMPARDTRKKSNEAKALGVCSGYSFHRTPAAEISL